MRMTQVFAHISHSLNLWKANGQRYAGLVFHRLIFCLAEENHTFQGDIQSENDVECSSQTSNLGLIMIAKVLCLEKKTSFHHKLEQLWRTELMHEGSSLFPIILSNDS